MVASEPESAVGDATSLGDVLAPLIRPAALNGRRARALRPWADPDLPLLEAIARGEYVLNGFRNRDVVPHLFTDPPSPPEERKRITTRITCRLRILRGHGLVRKVPGTHRYQVIAKGRQLIAAVLVANAGSTAKLKQSA
ncbi:MAG: hypothetical protein HY812_14980 [Planctomycetes bacterium]|nr:hypothetical protein [Planctomycetota bacterium]